MVKYAICGLGSEGRAALSYYQAKEPDAEFLLVDENSPDADISDFSQIPNDFLIIRSPGISVHKLPKDAVSAGMVWSGTNEFFKQCPCPIIGVTGTKGKGTTSSIITRLLEAHLPNEQNVHLLGNIGVPALSKLAEIKPNDVVVFELSSFQLWDLQFSPHIAVLTIFEPDHLDVHASFDEYLQAKSRIWRFQTDNDTLIYNSDDELQTKLLRLDCADLATNENQAGESDEMHGGDSRKHKNDGLPVRINGISAQTIAYPIDSTVTKKTSEQINLPGAHNQYNTQAALLAVYQILFERVIMPNRLITESVLINFEGLDHRLKLVSTINEVQFYDDSIATTPSSALAGLRSFDQNVILLLGGKDKGGDYTSLIPALEEKAQSGKLRSVILYGENRERIKAAINNTLKAANVRLIVIDKLDAEQVFDEIFTHIRMLSERGDVVLFSPAAASFDMFTNYAQRGDAFINSVSLLSNSLKRSTIYSLDNKPTKTYEVAIFDSGKGGNTVAIKFANLANAHPLLPEITYSVLADSENVPYGSKTPEEICRLTEKCLDEVLTDKHINTLKVLACNTATAYAIDYLRKKYPEHQFVGFEPMIKPASLSSQTGNICVLATPATLKSERYQSLKQKFASQYQVFEPDCSDWALAIEQDNFTEEYILPLAQLIKEQNIDQVILACTHYIAVKEQIEQCLENNNLEVAVVEPTEAVFERTINLLLMLY